MSIVDIVFIVFRLFILFVLFILFILFIVYIVFRCLCSYFSPGFSWRDIPAWCTGCSNTWAFGIPNISKKILWKLQLFYHFVRIVTWCMWDLAACSRIPPCSTFFGVTGGANSAASIFGSENAISSTNSCVESTFGYKENQRVTFSLFLQ